MKFPSQTAQSSATALAITLLMASLSGCASPGPARPPSLHLPRLVTNLTAIRTGNNVTLHWITPDKTTDGLKVPSTLTAEVCRQLPAAPSSHPATPNCLTVKRLTVKPGPSEASEDLPNNLTTGPATLLTYRVQILNAHSHSAGLSSPAFVAAGAAPPPVENLQVTPIRGGAMLEWQPQPTQSVVELDRVLLEATIPHKPSTKQPLQSTPSTPAEIHLQSGEPSADPGGTIDPTAQRGKTYSYTAQRVFSVTLNGHHVELRSVPSTTITVVMNDTFPPKAPTGLAAIPSAGSIDLSWEPNTEPDLAGYIVYRQLVDSAGASTTTPTRLTPTPIPNPAFSDHSARPGQTYSYRVTAIDTARNESSTSNEAQESLRN